MTINPKPAKMSQTLESLLQPQVTEFWGNTYEFTPALVDRVWGDGKQLVQLFPINERPRYWLVRVDSAADTFDDWWTELLDDIYDAIDEQFGSPPEEDLGVGDERPYFPMYDGQGTVCHFVRAT